jgi:hypothetical protein
LTSTEVPVGMDAPTYRGIGYATVEALLNRLNQ